MKTSAIKKNPGTPAHVPTDETRHLVKTWAQVGTTQLVIARELGINELTLQKYYRDELSEATARGVATVASSLYAKAIAGDTTAMIFFLKTRGRWREKDDVVTDERAREIAERFAALDIVKTLQAQRPSKDQTSTIQ
jgi:hypothetical protein